MERLDKTYQTILDNITNNSGDTNERQTTATHLAVKNPLSEEERVPALVQLYHSRQNVPCNSNYTVFKVTNLSLETDNLDLINYFLPIKIPNSHSSPYFTECVHLVINNVTGMYDGFIEVPTKAMANELYSYVGGKRYLHGDLLNIQQSSQEELLRALFPRYKLSVVEDGHNTIEFLTRFEINALLNKCREIRSRGYRKMKVLSRPYQTIISILSKVPWHSPEVLTTIQRDHIFELSKLAIEAIRSTYKAKDYSNILGRLVRATLAVPLFTEKQKTMILATAHMKCPQDMASFVYLPLEPAVIPNTCEFVRSRQSSSSTLNQVEPNTDTARLEQKVYIATKAYQELYLEHQKTVQQLQELNDMYRRLTRSYDVLEKYCNQLQADKIVGEQVNESFSQRAKSKRTFVDPTVPSDNADKAQSELTLKWIKSQNFK
ncbi:hypothetical protein HK103_003952 [Boothiomyces macroporosus]|uniref:Uncharacterized protein n=1 Tax=Boothiomyces macroporosus TaxID=261099 RepID=A0AAD5YB72_9FUNG|nr:hypothetical protein HK103_003952 [Boothiomyces macroporosus]